MTSWLNKKLYVLNVVCEIKEEFLILWRELSTTTKQSKHHQEFIIQLLVDAEAIKNNITKEL
jgi:hypothetical protein